MLDTEAPMTITPEARRNGVVTAVEVVDLRKEFIRRKRRGRFRRERKRVAALEGVSFTMLKGETLAILGQNGSGKSTLVRLLSTLLLDDGGSVTIFGHDVTTEHRAVRRLVNRVSVEASFFKKMSAIENLSYAARYYGHGAVADARPDPGDPRARALPEGPAHRLDGEPLARDAAEGRARAGAPHLAGAAPARRADDGPRPALEARGAGVHPRDPDDRTTRPSCSARTTSPRRRRSPSGSASSTRGS